MAKKPHKRLKGPSNGSEPRLGEIVRAGEHPQDGDEKPRGRYALGTSEHDPRTDTRQLVVHSAPAKLQALLAAGEMGTDLPTPRQIVDPLREMLPAVRGAVSEETALVVKERVAEVEVALENYARILHDYEVEKERVEDLHKDALRNANSLVRDSQDRAHRMARELKQANDSLAELAALVGVKLVNVDARGLESGSVDPVSKREEIVLKVAAMARASRETEDRFSDYEAKLAVREQRIAELEDLLVEARGGGK